MNRPFLLKSENNAGGYAILELLFYVSFFGAISITVIYSLVTMIGTFRETAVYAALAQGGTVMERMTREIREARDITFTGTGALGLSSTDGSGNPQTMQFLLTNTDIQFRENDVLVGSLNSGDVAVDSLIFTPVATGESIGVRVHMAVRAKNDPQGRTVDFYDTVTLRGSY